MNLETWHLVAGGAAALLGWKKFDALKALLGGLWPKAKPAPAEDLVLARMKLALELRAACEQACPEAIKHIDQAIPHLLPGHIEVAK